MLSNRDRYCAVARYLKVLAFGKLFGIKVELDAAFTDTSNRNDGYFITSVFDFLLHRFLATIWGKDVTATNVTSFTYPSR